MSTQTINNWPDPEIKYEGVSPKLEHRPRKRRKRQIDWESVLGGMIILFAVFGWYLLMYVFCG